MTTPYILPTRGRILRGIRASLSELLKREQLTDAGRESVESIGLLLNELQQRENIDFYIAAFKRGRELVTRWNEASARAASLDLPQEPAPDASFDVWAAAIAAMAGTLAEVMKQAIGSDKETVARIFEWEAALYESRGRISAEATERPASRIDVDRLGDYLARRGARLLEFRPAVGGYQNETAFLSVEDSAGTAREWVLRGDKADRFINLDAGSVVDEYVILEAVRECGIPIAAPLWVEADERQIGCRFLVSERVEGRVPSAIFTGAAPSEAVLRTLTETLADIHCLSLEDRLHGSRIGHWLQWPTLPENTLAVVRRWYKQPWIPRLMASPAVTGMLAWLEANVPTHNGRRVLLHGDYGAHNVMAEGDRLVAVLDWEAARFGDPAEDISYMLFYLGDKVDRGTVLGWYERRAGFSVPIENLDYFDVFNRLKVLICCAFAGALYEFDPQAVVRWSLLSMTGHHAGLVGAMEALRKMK